MTIKERYYKWYYHARHVWTWKLYYWFRRNFPMKHFDNIRRRWFGLIKRYDLVVYEYDWKKKNLKGVEQTITERRFGQIEKISTYPGDRHDYIIMDICPCTRMGNSFKVTKDRVVQNIEWDRNSYFYDYLAGLHDALTDRLYDLRSDADCEGKDRDGVCQCSNDMCEIDFEPEEYWMEVINEY